MIRSMVLSVLMVWCPALVIAQPLVATFGVDLLTAQPRDTGLLRCQAQVRNSTSRPCKHDFLDVLHPSFTGR